VVKNFGVFPIFFLDENAFSGLSLGNHQNIGVLETYNFSRQTAKMAVKHECGRQNAE
jgi:hypothetical protein